MASRVTAVVIGDYKYTLYDDQTAWAWVTDKHKTSYGALQTSVTHEGVTYALTSVRSCFMDCTSLTTAPSIPSGVTDMQQSFQGCTSLTTAPAIPSGVTTVEKCFYNCTALTTAPSIPSSVTKMSLCFQGCTSLTTVPAIPSSVTAVMQCFQDCTALTGTIFVHGAPEYYNNCFKNTTQPIVLEVFDTSEAPTWKRVAATGNNGNVTVRDVSANPAPTATITATRVASRGSTTPDENGQYAYVTVRTTASTEQAPDNVAQTPTITLDGSAYTPLDPSGTATFTCWVALGDERKHVIGATPRDLYKTGTTATVTLASTYSPMEFHATGDGASFGKHAERAGVLDVAWDIETDGDVSAAGDVSGASVTATGNVTAGGKVTATGEVEGSDCKSANYSLEDVGDSISQVELVTGYQGGTGVAVNANSKVRRSGRQVNAHLIFNVASNSGTASGATFVTGLPRPYETSWCTAALANGSKACRMYIDGNGNLRLDTARPDVGWWTCAVSYFTQD